MQTDFAVYEYMNSKECSYFVQAYARHCRYVVYPDTDHSPLCLDVVIGGTDEGSWGFTQMHRADCRLPTLQVTNCSPASCGKKFKGDNAFIHLCPGCGAQLDLALSLPDLAYNTACSVCEACMGTPRPATLLFH